MDVLTAGVFDVLPDTIAVVAPTGAIAAVNRAWERFAVRNGGDPKSCGAGANYLQACAAAATAGSREALLVFRGLSDVLAGVEDSFELEYPCHSPEEDRWFLLRVTPLGRAGCVVVSHVDITRRKHAEVALSDRADRDALTGLLNRRGLARREVEGAAVLFIDLDGFKEVNDRLGHSAGDEVLTAVASRLGHQLRSGDLVARIGGDEFVVVVDRDDDAEEVDGVAARMEEALSAPYRIGSDAVRLGASIGAARGAAGEPLAEVVARADAAMYRVKQRRRDRRAGASRQI